GRRRRSRPETRSRSKWSTDASERGSSDLRGSGEGARGNRRAPRARRRRPRRGAEALGARRGALPLLRGAAGGGRGEDRGAGEASRRGPPRGISSALVPAPPEISRKIELFESMSGRDLKRLSDSFKESSFSAGDVIATEGQR